MLPEEIVLATSLHEPLSSASLLIIVLIGVCSVLSRHAVPRCSELFFTTSHSCCTQHDSDDTQSLPPVHLNVPTRVAAAPAHYYPAASVSYYESVLLTELDTCRYNVQH